MITSVAELEGVKIRLQRNVAKGGDGSAFGLELQIPCACKKHAVADFISWKNGPPKIVVRHMIEDEFGQEWLDVTAAIDYLKPYVEKCPVCSA